MIRIATIARHGAAAPAGLSVDFGPEGGTIGRSPTNRLILDDPDRTVSRVHAQILCRDGAYFVIDRGSNPMQHNAQPLGAGNEARLASGDRLVIGSFELQVHDVPGSVEAGVPVAVSKRGAPPAMSDDDPFADLLGGIAPAPKASAALSPRAAAADPMLFPDPMRSGAPADDPFADLLGPAAAPPAPPAPLRPAPPRAPAGLLDDFSDLGLPASAQSGGIDALFGGMGGTNASLGGDPLALSPLADPLAQPNTGASADPLASLQTPLRTAPPAARSDHLPMGQFAYVPPAAAAPALSPRPAVPKAGALPEFSLDESASPLPDSGFDAPLSSAPLAEPPGAVSTPRASDDELLAAFLHGLASMHQPPQALTPGLMERIGIALRAATEGTLQLLLTRQEFKREVRAEVTMIASKANNPLKFSPTVEIALSHLLGPGMRGFMLPEAAMRDAYDDLRAHQFGVMVGMRAALAHVIARFEPAELEKKISAKSALDSLFAANRKARLWDQFVALYAGIAAEAEDDFHSLFGKAFVKAYEEQMERFKAEK